MGQPMYRYSNTPYQQGCNTFYPPHQYTNNNFRESYRNQYQYRRDKYLEPRSFSHDPSPRRRQNFHVAGYCSNKEAKTQAYDCLPYDDKRNVNENRNARHHGYTGFQLNAISTRRYSSRLDKKCNTRDIIVSESLEEQKQKYLAQSKRTVIAALKKVIETEKNFEESKSTVITTLSHNNSHKISYVKGKCPVNAPESENIADSSQQIVFKDTLVKELTNQIAILRQQKRSLEENKALLEHKNNKLETNLQRTCHDKRDLNQRLKNLENKLREAHAKTNILLNELEETKHKKNSLQKTLSPLTEQLNETKHELYVEIEESKCDRINIQKEKQNDQSAIAETEKLQKNIVELDIPKEELRNRYLSPLCNFTNFDEIRNFSIVQDVDVDKKKKKKKIIITVNSSHKYSESEERKFCKSNTRPRRPHSLDVRHISRQTLYGNFEKMTMPLRKKYILLLKRTFKL